MERKDESHENLKLLIHSAKQIVRITTKNELHLKGNDMQNVSVLEQKENEEGFSIVVGSNGLILAIDRDSEIRRQFKGKTFDSIIDATGRVVLPGLIDAHTHPVWAGDRVHEFSLKLKGATYMEIHKAGGGIHFTVDATRRASADNLLASLEERLERMLGAGTTLVEAKSGYGLNLDNEMKLLRVLTQASRTNPMELSITYCGAHAVPKGWNSEETVKNIIEHQLPAIGRLKASEEILVDNIDVFCETGVFDVQETERILKAGASWGLQANFHGDELQPLKAAEMAAKIHARTISHVERISTEGIKGLAASSTVAVLLPTTAYLLHLQPPPVREMIDAGVIVALGTDFNPNSFCLSMPLTMHLACVLYHMSMEEAIVAATINAAASLNKSATHGSLEVGKVADLIVIKAPRWEHLIYQMGGHDHVIQYVIKRGKIVHETLQKTAGKSLGSFI